MKILSFTTIAFAAFLATQAQAGRVLTYTATSTVSQEDANNSAVAGVAKQISTQVTTTQVLKKEDIVVDGKETLAETYKAQNNLTSNLKLKGVKIIPGKKEGNSFSATATLDLDEFTADIQFKMNTEKLEIAKAEKSIQEAIDHRLYADAIKILDQAKPRVTTYEKLLQQLAQVYPISEKHRLNHSIPELEKNLVQSISKITISVPSEKQELSSSEMSPWQIQVYDNQGPLPDFPVVIHQGKGTLASVKTDAKGIALIQLKKVNFEEGPYVIYVEPGLSLAILKQAGLQKKYEVSYSVVQKKYPIKMECSESGNICNAIKEGLAKKSIVTAESEETLIPVVSFKVSSEQKNSLNTGSTALTSYDVNIFVSGKDIATSFASRSVGKNKNEAIVKAIQKTDFSKLQKLLESLDK